MPGSPGAGSAQSFGAVTVFGPLLRIAEYRTARGHKFHAVRNFSIGGGLAATKGTRENCGSENLLSYEEKLMKTHKFTRGLLVATLAAASFAVACGHGGVEGKYRDPSGTINCSFEDGKAYIGLGVYAVDGTYKIEGDKIIATGDFGMMLPHTIIFTVNKDGSIDPQRDTPIPRLEKVKN
jgi:hypothetical protein